MKYQLEFACFEGRLFYPISLWSKISVPEQRAISTANYIIQFQTGIKVSHSLQEFKLVKGHQPPLQTGSKPSSTDKKLRKSIIFWSVWSSKPHFLRNPIAF